MLIQVKDKATGVIYNNDMSQNKHCILSINFCTSYTQVEVQDMVNIDGEIRFPVHNIIVPSLNGNLHWIDEIAIQNDSMGEWL